MNEKKPKFQLPDFGTGDQTRAAQSTTWQLLEETRLSRLKPLPKRPACLACGDALEAENEFQQATRVCRKCINHFAKVGLIFDAYAEQKARRNANGNCGRQNY
jgi:hypothetical protein